MSGTYGSLPSVTKIYGVPDREDAEWGNKVHLPAALRWRPFSATTSPSCCAYDMSGNWH